MSIRAFIERWLSPGIGKCYRCNRPWICPAQQYVGNRTWRQLPHDRYRGLIGVKPHITNYTLGSGCFPLCEPCWTALETPEARLPYYKQLWDSWVESSIRGRYPL